MRKLSRNHKLLIAITSCLLFWSLLLTVIIASCSKGEEKPRNEGAALIPVAKGSLPTTNYTIAYDPDTGVEYFVCGEHLTPLYTADGQLKIYQPKGE